MNTKSETTGAIVTKRRMLKDAKYRAKKQGLPFNLTEDDFEIPTHCPALGLTLRRRHRDLSPSLDRLVPELGYVKGNVIVVSNRANRMKNDATVHELETVASFYRDHITKHLME